MCGDQDVRDRGPSVARNRAIAECSGRYVLPVDADNMLLPDAVERLVSQLQMAGEQIGFVYQNCQYFGNRRGLLRASYLQRVGPDAPELHRHLCADRSRGVRSRARLCRGHLLRPRGLGLLPEACRRRHPRRAGARQDAPVPKGVLHAIRPGRVDRHELPPRAGCAPPEPDCGTPRIRRGHRPRACASRRTGRRPCHSSLSPLTRRTSPPGESSAPRWDVEQIPRFRAVGLTRPGARRGRGCDGSSAGPTLGP